MVHRDLKLQNILLASKDSYDIRVADFGFSSFFDPKKGFTEIVGTPMFMAPELLKEEQYDEKVDIWSIGIITYMLLSGRAPFSGKTKKDMHNLILATEINVNKKYFDEISSEAKDFIKKCCTKNQINRPTAADLLKHPWIVKQM